MTSKKEVKLINFTAVFENLNIQSISDDELKKSIGFSPEKDQGTSTIEAPGLKALILPYRKRGIIFEQNRIRFDDTSGNEPRNTDIIDYFVNISDLIAQNNFLAYGYNFEVLAKREEDFNFEEFLVAKIKNSIDGKIEGVGAVLAFSSNNTKYNLDIKPTGNPKELFFHLNVHYSADKIPDKDYLTQTMEKNYDLFQDIMNKIVS